MRLRRLFAVAAAGALLAACAEPPKPDAAAAAISAPTTTGAHAVPAAQQAQFTANLRARLRRLVAAEPKAPIQLVDREDDLPAMRIDGAAFEGESGELLPALLMPLRELAQLAASCGCVVHVIGEQIGDEVSPALDPGERRAAAVAAVLLDFGASPDDLRHDSLIVPGRAGGVDIVLRPIVTEHPEQAWMPPAVGEGGS